MDSKGKYYCNLTNKNKVLLPINIFDVYGLLEIHYQNGKIKNEYSHNFSGVR